MLRHICGIQKNDTDELMCKAKIETQMQRQTYVRIPRGKRDSGMNWETSTDTMYKLSN